MSTINTTQVEDYTPYLQQLSEGKKKRKKAALEEAYRQSLAAIEQAEGGLEGTYRAAANAAAGNAAVSQRNFDQYAAAGGLGSGAAGQARLAKTVALQSDLNKLEAGKAQDKSDLALQKTAARQEYQSGLAQADAEAEESLAQALYEESVRLAQAQYQAQRDAAEDERWRQEQAYQASRDAVEDSRWQQSMNYQTSRDTTQDEQWRKELEFAIQKYWYDQGYTTPPVSLWESQTGGEDSSSNTSGAAADVKSVALQVIRGEWGNGAQRKQRLTAAGYDYNAVQSMVDALLAGKG